MSGHCPGMFDQISPDHPDKNSCEGRSSLPFRWFDGSQGARRSQIDKGCRRDDPGYGFLGGIHSDHLRPLLQSNGTKGSARAASVEQYNVVGYLVFVHGQLLGVPWISRLVASFSLNADIAPAEARMGRANGCLDPSKASLARSDLIQSDSAFRTYSYVTSRSPTVDR